MTGLERKQYNLALKIVKAYPDAVKIIVRYAGQMADEDKDTVERGNINLVKNLPVRAYNVLRKYFSDNYHVSMNFNDFPIDILINVNLEKLKNTRNCGRHTFETIEELIRKEKVK